MQALRRAYRTPSVPSLQHLPRPSHRRPFATLNPHTLPSPAPTTITPTTSELRTSTLSPHHLEAAITALHRDGLVVIRHAIPLPLLTALNDTMTADAHALLSRPDLPFNYNRSNIQQDPPPLAPHFHPAIFFNPLAAQITSTHLGARPKFTFCSGNTALPPSLSGLRDVPEEQTRQPVHSDADFAHPSIPFACVVNVPLVDMTLDNGATEVWLGTHRGSAGAASEGLECQVGRHGERASGRIRQELLDEWRREVGEPVRTTVDKGSVVVRDLRLWHAGVGNRGADLRVMLAMIHFAPWYRNRMKLELSEGCRPMVEEHAERLRIEVPVDWVSEEVAADRYLRRGFGNAYDFSQAE